MPKQFKALLLLAEIAAAMLISSCNSQLWNVGTPPYAITKPVYRIAGPDDVCTLGGVFFDFYNKAEKEVVYIKTCMNVFDLTATEPALFSSKRLISEASCLLKPNETKNLCIPLDDYLWKLKTPAICVDNFCITVIEYSDGSVWQDYTGIYSNSYKEEV